MKIPLFAANVLERWKRIARKIGDVQARIILTLFYILVVGPPALLVRWRSDPLGIKSGTPRGWIPRIDREGAPIKRATEQF